MAKNILITLNALKDNRGSEALIRGLVRICKERYPDCNITISSGAKGDIQTVIPDVAEMVPRRDISSRFAKLAAKVSDKLYHDIDRSEKYYYRSLISASKKADVIFVIGADNYDASYNMHGLMRRINTYILNAAKGTVVMYDCSLEESHLTNDVVKDIGRFGIITVRESVTKLVFEKRFDKNKIKYFPDPAFVMLPEECRLPEGYEEGRMVGINLSSLIASGKYGTKSELLVQSYRNMIDYILSGTDLKVVFIPHVMGNADLSMLRKLYENYRENDRVLLIEDETYNAAQLKYIISKLSYLVTARTHASIAAYSMCVPTLVIGYSVKSIGIAADLFGTDEGYVVPSNDISTGTELTDAFKWLVENGQKMHDELTRIMPEYQAKAMKTGDLLDVSM